MTSRLDLPPGAFEPCCAVGVVYRHQLICGVVWHDYRAPDIRASIAASSPAWATRRVLARLFDYPFNQLHCTRVTACVRGSDTDIQAFDRRLGFTQEGILRKAWHVDDDDCVLFGMLKEECRWLR